MASWSFFQEEDFLCPVCYDIFRDPVVLPCSHSACKTCMEEYWKYKDDRECPVCRKRSSMPFPTVSLTLKRLCEGFLQERSSRDAEPGSERLCGQHKAELKLFCLEDEQTVCLVCRDSRRHTGHKFCPIDEVVQDQEERVKAELGPLKEKLRLYTEAKQTCGQTEKYLMTQAAETHREIKKEFQHLHQLLVKEEEARINALIEEEKEKTRMVKEKTKEISKIISTLSDTIQAVEERLEGDHVTFLQRYKAILHKARAQSTFLDPQLVSGALVEVAKHLGNLQSRIWKKMQGDMKYCKYSSVE
uniref:Tripartite motif-containing protein 35-like n=1 Tax=Salmo trutta TaxID=8032 RepID=A0A673VWQ1_SALTR